MAAPLEPATLAGREVWLKREDGPIVLVVTGRNIDDELLERARLRADSFPD